MYKLLLSLSLMLIVGISCHTPEKVQTSVISQPNAKYKLTAFSPSVNFADAKVTDWTYNKTKMYVAIGEGSYKLTEQTSDAALKMCANSKDGQHIHVIVDDKPYDAQYETSFEYKIPDGEHNILTFLSRSYHESIKNGQAFKAIKAKVKNNTFESKTPIVNPMLFYSRPKGNYIGPEQTNKVMLDFFLVNADLGKNYKVRADINGEMHIINTWQPYYIEGLPMGDNTIVLTLVDANLKPVSTPLNPVTRTFKLMADPANTPKN